MIYIHLAKCFNPFNLDPEKTMALKTVPYSGYLKLSRDTSVTKHINATISNHYSYTVHGCSLNILWSTNSLGEFLERKWSTVKGLMIRT